MFKAVSRFWSHFGKWSKSGFWGYYASFCHMNYEWKGLDSVVFEWDLEVSPVFLSHRPVWGDGVEGWWETPETQESSQVLLSSVHTTRLCQWTHSCSRSWLERRGGGLWGIHSDPAGVCVSPLDKHRSEENGCTDWNIGPVSSLVAHSDLLNQWMLESYGWCWCLFLSLYWTVSLTGKPLVFSQAEFSSPAQDRLQHPCLCRRHFHEDLKSEIKMSHKQLESGFPNFLTSKLVVLEISDLMLWRYTNRPNQKQQIKKNKIGPKFTCRVENETTELLSW